MSHKRQCVDRWIREARPDWVVDFGCNTGEFSRMAMAAGANVVAVDADHDSVQELYLQSRGDTRLFPMVANLGDLVGGRGWSSSEFASSLDRLTRVPDVVLMLALLHHLAISHSIPYPAIAEFAHRVTRRFLIVEFIEATDPLVHELCSQRRRDPNEVTLEGQREAFARWFEPVTEEQIAGTHRRLVLMRRIER